MAHRVRVLDRTMLTHDVVRLTLERPEGFDFQSGQAIELSSDVPALHGRNAAFSFTGVNSDDHLELTIKTYPERKGITAHIAGMRVGDEVIISDPWDSVVYRGPGVFIAGGTGITPFISIFRQLARMGYLSGNRLFFSNKTAADVILEHELRQLLGPAFTSILTREKRRGHAHGHIDAAFLEKHITDFQRPFYVCGPEPFTTAVHTVLETNGADEALMEVHF